MITYMITGLIIGYVYDQYHHKESQTGGGCGCDEAHSEITGIELLGDKDPSDMGASIDQDDVQISDADLYRAIEQVVADHTETL
jgi:hypothetical protein